MNTPPKRSKPHPTQAAPSKKSPLEYFPALDSALEAAGDAFDPVLSAKLDRALVYAEAEELI